MKQITSIHLCGLVLLATLMLVDSTPYQIHNLIRKRREPEPEPASSSTPSSSSSSSSSSSPHDSHEVKCEDKDTSSLKKSCPNNDTCPMDDNTVEKCCHCLSLCCGSESGSSSEEGGMHMKNGTMNDSASGEPEPEPGKGGKGKEIGNKVKDALNSAEGWLKNTGQNIKSGFDKAAENAKQTAGEMKDKVRQGINNVATKVKNATEGDKSECKGKGALTTTPHNAEVIDSKCSTDMDMSKSGDGEGDNMSGSTESSSGMNMSMNDTTPVPGYKKSKREAASPGSLQTSYSSRGSRDSMDDRGDGDSTEITRTKSTTTRTKDSSRHRREQRGNGSDAPSSTPKQSRNDRAAVEMSTEIPASTMSPQSNHGRKKRDTTHDNVPTTENSSSKGGNQRNRRAASEMSTELPGSTMSPQSNHGRNKRDATKEGMSTTENSSSKEGTHRHRRAAGTANPDSGMVSSTTNPKEKRDRRAAPSKGETTTMSPDSSSTSAPSSEEDTDEEADDEDSEDTTTEPSKNMMKGKSIRPKNASVSVSLRVNDTSSAKRRINSGNVYFPISPGTTSGGSMFMDSQDETDYYGDGMDRPPTMVFPGGGVIASPGIGIQSIKKGNGVPDLSYHPPQASTSLSLDSSLSGSIQGGRYNQRGAGAMGGSMYGGGGVGRGPIGAGLKPGSCQTLAAGAVNCMALQSRPEKCSFDAECSGIKKCCFYQCDMYKQVGVCEVPTLTRNKIGY